MKNNKHNSNESLNLKSFILGEIVGCLQVIIDNRIISDNEYYVITVGKPPKINVAHGCNLKELERNT